MLFNIDWKSSFVQNILKLFSGTSLRNLIVFLTLPILTRLYTTEDFGNFELLISITTLLGMVGSLKYDVALVIPQYRKEAHHVVVLALVALGVFTLIMGGILYVQGDRFLKVLNASQLAPYIHYLIVGVLFLGFMQILRFWLIRHKAFGFSAIAQVTQAVLTQGGAIVLGLIRPSFFGLFISYIGGMAGAALLILRKFSPELKGISVRYLRLFAYKYRKFPLFNTPSAFINNFSLQIPVYLISAFFGADVLGLYALANRLLATPVNLITYSISQVYYQRATESFHKGPEHLLRLYQKIVLKLATIGLIPFALVFIIAPMAVKVILGEQWAESGTFMQIIVIWMYFSFITVPISTTFTVMNQLEIPLMLRIVSLLTRFGAMYLFRSTPQEMLWALSITASLYYIFYNWLIYFHLKRKVGHAG